MIQRKSISTCILILGLAISITARAQMNNSILGKWKAVEDSQRQIEFVQEKDNSFSGLVINNKSKESENGKVILRNLKFDPKSKTYKGKMSPPDKDLSLDATVYFIGSDKLKVRSGMLFITKEIYFERIK